MFLQAFKYDGAAHYQQPIRLLSATPTHRVVFGEGQRRLEHFSRGQDFVVENYSLEFYWTDRWYSIGFELDKQGKLEMVYCNIAKPAEFNEDGVYLTDMDLDLIFDSDLNPKLVARDEFVENRDKYGYTAEEIAQCLRAVADIVALAEQGEYPFDGSWQRIFADQRTE